MMLCHYYKRIEIFPTSVVVQVEGVVITFKALGFEFETFIGNYLFTITIEMCLVEIQLKRVIHSLSRFNNPLL
jgi:hypothetical protein